jgi:hypothetical protein
MKYKNNSKRHAQKQQTQRLYRIQTCHQIPRNHSISLQRDFSRKKTPLTLALSLLPHQVQSPGDH